jgi:rare lipoprotein A
MSKRVFSARFARGCRMATLVTACLVGAAINEGHAATRTDLVKTSLPSAHVPATVFAMRFDCSRTSLVVNIPTTDALQAPPSGLELPLASRFMPASDPIKGIASTYNPGDPGDLHAGGGKTASGEKYDPEDWSAAIRVDLRDKFGFGKTSYQSTYALVESADKRVIVKVNDVGSLRPGRIIDLNIRAMRYFDPTLELGLINNIKVTPLVGNDMTPGPVENDPPTNFGGWFV